MIPPLFPGKLSSCPGKSIAWALRTPAGRDSPPPARASPEARAMPTTVFQTGGSSGWEPGPAMPLCLSHME